ncbi:polymer-forming cytoskeletal protein [bacterium]|nr:polymer-forming cytoskeletal protein [bacterium]
MADKFTGRDEERLNTIIGQGTVIKGECSVNGTVRVDGVIDGSLTAKGMAILGKSGQIKGDLLVHNAIVGGKIDGSVIAEGRLELQTGASVEGDITARRLVVEEGVFFHGLCSMKDEPKPTVAAAAAASTPQAAKPEEKGKEKEKPKSQEVKDPSKTPASTTQAAMTLNQPQAAQGGKKVKIEESGKDDEDQELTFHGRPL